MIAFKPQGRFFIGMIDKTIVALSASNRPYVLPARQFNTGIQA